MAKMIEKRQGARHQISPSHYVFGIGWKCCALHKDFLTREDVLLNILKPVPGGHPISIADSFEVSMTGRPTDIPSQTASYC